MPFNSRFVKTLLSCLAFTATVSVGATEYEVTTVATGYATVTTVAAVAAVTASTANVYV